MNRKIIEYLIIATAILLLAYGFYSYMSYDYKDMETKVETDSISMYYPSTSQYTVSGDRIEFRNSFHDFYDMDVSKLNSSDKRVTELINHYSSFKNWRSIDYKNESCYLITIEYEDANGFKYHSIIIPFDSFDKDKGSFTKDTDVFLFDGRSKEFVLDSAFNSQGVL